MVAGVSKYWIGQALQIVNMIVHLLYTSDGF